MYGITDAELAVLKKSDARDVKQGRLVQVNETIYLVAEPKSEQALRCRLLLNILLDYFNKRGVDVSASYLLHFK